MSVGFYETAKNLGLLSRRFTLAHTAHAIQCIMGYFGIAWLACLVMYQNPPHHSRQDTAWCSIGPVQITGIKRLCRPCLPGAVCQTDRQRGEWPFHFYVGWILLVILVWTTIFPCQKYLISSFPTPSNNVTRSWIDGTNTNYTWINVEV